MAAHITIDDDDDRPERMVRDPDRYFAAARERAEQELAHQARKACSPRCAGSTNKPNARLARLTPQRPWPAGATGRRIS